VRDYFEQLNRSFAACYRLLERPRAAQRAVVALLTVHTALLAYSAYVHSPTRNEPGHLVAGLSIWKFGRFDVYNVNPPLVKMVAALPVIAAGYGEDWSGFYSGPGARPEFAMGEDFVAANGERSFFLFMIARWACLPFSWIGGIVCYLWARDLYGRPSGVLACSIWCFEPNILTHASLITPDAPATVLGLAACYTFWRWLKKPTWSQAALTGVVLGLAELAKTTLILFYPLWPVMWVAYRWPDRKSMAARDWFREGGMLALRMAAGLYVLNMGYGFEASFRPLGEFRFVSELFTGEVRARRSDIGVSGTTTSNASSTPLAPRPSSANRLDGTWLASIPFPLPANYLLGIDQQQEDFEHYGKPSYLRGQWSDQGWWYYYVYAIAIKVPLGLLALGVLTQVANAIPSARQLLSGLSSTASASLPISLRDLFILLLPPLVILLVVSAKTGINEHMRYALPSFPFFLIGVSACLKNLVDIGHGTFVNCAPHRRACPLALTLLLWSVVSSWWIYPHSLSYFNESIGGPLNGPKHLLGSCVDWGQDLRYMQQMLAGQSRRRPIVVACLSHARITDKGLSESSIQQLDGDPTPENAWFLISWNFFRGAQGAAWDCRSEGSYSLDKVAVQELQAYARGVPSCYSHVFLSMQPEFDERDR
jgi:4-amino-4-deoxy-L-arabinose transferase-like glycosyltransferase